MKTNLQGVKHCLALSRDAFDAVKREYRPGMSEADIRQLMCSAWERPEQPPITFSGDVVGGARSAAIEGEATDYVLQVGDALILDIQPGCEGSFADVTRTFFFGEPSQEQRQVYAALQDTIARLEPLLRPGTKACDIHRRMQEALAGHGYTCPHHAGHAVGPEKFLQPQFVEECTAPLEAGMVVTLEPGVYVDDRFGIRLENNYLITPDGCEELFQYPMDIPHFVIK